MTEFVFWSGGFDSTSYILESLLVKEKTVQPIVVTEKTIDGFNKPERSTYHEQQARIFLRSQINKQFPKQSKNLLPEKIYSSVHLTEESYNLGKNLYKLGYWDRPVKQGLFLYEVGKELNTYIFYGVTKEDKSYTDLNLHKYVDSNYILQKNYPEHLTHYRYFKNSYLKKTKEDILKIAIKHDFDSLLYNTWSCWYPQRDNSPCGLCEMCKGRIIECKFDISKNFI